ncbi:MAG TPA: SDR family NAD(P)-dependent oxidoreductase [Myxococcales bacterium]|jgi:NAD(P)-dependent dehydrogenase (short-subunit alcohol dehydrogenase family)|nr:SDR family NAD(P)-dependent oxidoreductase [Myxococcales bacterium]
MKLAGKVCVVTGGANGIGQALSLKFAVEGAIVIVADRDAAKAAEVAALAKAESAACDVSKESEIAALVQSTLQKHGRIDLFASNAGIATSGGAEDSNADWQRSWDVNLMAHVWAARHVLPSMIARKEGYLLNTASAAGLLTSLGAAAYAATKHAAVAFAEWLSMTHHDQGIRVSCLCPQGVQTNMLAEAVKNNLGKAILAAGAVLTPEQVADIVVQGLADERFLILPHPEVAKYLQHRALDHERWLAGMRKVQKQMS